MGRMIQEIFDPPHLTPEYPVTLARAPSKALVSVPEKWFDRAPGPAFGRIPVRPEDADLTAAGGGLPLGQLIVLHGKVTDSSGAPVKGALIEIWQANASGRYVDLADPWGLPLDPNFIGAGRCVTDANGQYWFRTIRPAPYPTISRPGVGGWRAAHIHFSLFGVGVTDRLITQMYFPDDPILKTDTIFQAIPDERARQSLVAQFELDNSVVDFDNAPGFLGSILDGTLHLKPRKAVEDEAAKGGVPLQAPIRSATSFRFDIVLRGARATPLERAE